MTSFTEPKSHAPPKRDPDPDVLPLPVEPDRGPAPELPPEDPGHDGVMPPTAQALTEISKR